MSLTNEKSADLKLTVVEPNNLNNVYCEIIINKNMLSPSAFDFLISNKKPPKLEICLTQKEKMVLKHMSDGENNKVIANNLNVSIHTIKVHIRNIFSKLSVNDRTEAVVTAIKYNLIDIFE